MNNAPNISVIIPTYNRDKLLLPLLNRWLDVQNKTKYSFEMIFSDDGSTDNTKKILEGFNGLPITVVLNNHGGPGRAKESALKVARGELVLFTADDIFPNDDFLNNHYDYYLKHGPLVATLGRIEWKSDIPVTYLMHHITNIGCEQYGFAGLRPFSFVDFRHFYGSNTSIARDTLQRLTHIFDHSFDRYGFEDIELGYRLSRIGVKIFYAPNIYGEHEHIYSDYKKFANRQFCSGQMLANFYRIHPNVTSFEIKFDIAGIVKHRLLKGWRSLIDPKALALTVVIKYFLPLIMSALEPIVSANKNNQRRPKAEKLLSILYSLYFSHKLFEGFFTGVTGRSVITNSVFSSRVMLSNTSQIYHGVKDDFSELESQRFYNISKFNTIEANYNAEQKIRRIRFDPSNEPCVIKAISGTAKLSNGEKINLFFGFTNGTTANKLDFTGCDNPLLISDDYESKSSITSVQIRFTLEKNTDKIPLYFILNAKRILKLLQYAVKGFAYFFNKISQIGSSIPQGQPVNSTLKSPYTPQRPTWFTATPPSKFGQVLIVKCSAIDEIYLESLRSTLSLFNIKVLAEQELVVSDTTIGANDAIYEYSFNPSDKPAHPILALHAILALRNCNANTTIYASEELTEWPNTISQNQRPHTFTSFNESDNPKEIRFIRLKCNYSAIDCKPTSTIFDLKLKPCPTDSIDAATLKSFFGTPNDHLKNLKIILVLPTFMSVGGVERNTIEVINNSPDNYFFVIATYERHNDKIGSLFHQLDTSKSLYLDLAEITTPNNYLSYLSLLKNNFNPISVWIPNSNPWAYQNISNLRELFSTCRIVSQDIYDTNHGWIEMYKSNVITQYDSIIAVNRKIKEQLIKFGYNSADIELIYPAIHTKKFANVSSELQSGIRIGFIGRLADQKNPLLFIAAANEAAATSSIPLKFIVAGDGPLRGVVTETIKSSTTPISYIGHVEDVRHFFEQIDILVITSNYEGMPIVSIEAMCTGIPIISTDVGDVRHFIDRFRNGLIVNENNSQSIADAILNVANNYRKFKEQAQLARPEAAETFDIETAVSLTLNTLDPSQAPLDETSTLPKDHFTKIDKTPLISVVIPSFNHASFLSKTINSVVNQSYTNWELIIIDDGSKDNSREILEGFSNNKKIRLIFQENQGAHNAINNGLRLTRGDHIAILNSDDYFNEDRFSRYLECVKTTGSAFYSSYINIVNAEDKILGIKEGWHNCEPWPVPNRSTSFLSGNDFFLALLCGNFIATTSNMIFSREVYNSIGGMRNLRYAHDWDFALRASSKFKSHLDNTPSINYRIHQTNTIKSGKSDLIFENCWMTGIHLARNIDKFKNPVNDSIALMSSINLSGCEWIAMALMNSALSNQSASSNEPNDLDEIELSLLHNQHLRELALKLIEQRTAQ